MSAAIIVAAWLACGVVGYFLTRWWWTATLDWTTSERAIGLFFILGGPANILTALLLVGIRALDDRDARTLKERRR